MSWFTEHRTALSGAATVALSVLVSPQVAAISPSIGTTATGVMGAITGLIGIYNTFQKFKASQNTANQQPPTIR
jgi:hypothetical protein